MIQGKAIYTALQQLLGLDPVLLISVWVSVSILAYGLRVRERFDTKDGRSFALAILCFVVSAGVVWITQPKISSEDITTKMLKLAGISSLSYQLVKPMMRGLTRMVFKRFEQKTGIEIEGGEDD